MYEESKNSLFNGSKQNNYKPLTKYDDDDDDDEQIN
jgi:hypothetical protein